MTLELDLLIDTTSPHNMPGTGRMDPAGDGFIAA
jgi:hypothetical protein